MKLLIVEDNSEICRLIVKIVQELSDSIFECRDGARALTAYRKHLPDWVLMDINVGSVDGIAATRQIVASFPDARIAIVTDYDDDNLRRAAREAGAREYILKENLIDLRSLFAR